MKRRRKKGGVVPASEPRTTIEGGSIPPELVRLRDSRGAYHRFVEIESDSALARDVVKVDSSACRSSYSSKSPSSSKSKSTKRKRSHDHHGRTKVDLRAIDRTLQATLRDHAGIFPGSRAILRRFLAVHRRGSARAGRTCRGPELSSARPCNIVSNLMPQVRPKTIKSSPKGRPMSRRLRRRKRLRSIRRWKSCVRTILR